MALPVLIALGVGAKVAARVAPKIYDKYKKIRKQARTAKTNAAKKSAIEKANKLATQVKQAEARSKIKGFGQQTRIGAEKVKQSKLQTKKMKNFGNINKKKNVVEKVVDKGKDVAVEATKKTGNILMKPFSAGRTGVSRTTGFFGREKDPRRLVRKGLTVSAFGLSDASDATVRKVGGDKMGDAFTKGKRKFLGMRGGGKIQYNIDNQGQDFVKKMYGGKVKK